MSDEDEFAAAIFALNQHLTREKVLAAGWKQIATTLLKIGFGEDAASFDVPPLEIIESPASGQQIAMLAQWWANLTFADSEKRAHRWRAVHRDVADYLEPGDRAFVDEMGRVRLAVIDAAEDEDLQADANGDPIVRGAVFGIAGEPLRAGDLVALGSDGRIRRASR